MKCVFLGCEARQGMIELARGGRIVLRGGSPRDAGDWRMGRARHSVGKTSGKSRPVAALRQIASVSSHQRIFGYSREYGTSR